MKLWAGVFLILIFAACATTPLPPLELNAPGWQVRQAQAIWTTGRDKPEIVGDVLLSMNGRGSAFLQFSKTLPIASVRIEPHLWEVDFPPQKRHYSGRGGGPKQIVWLQLLHLLAGDALAPPWSCTERSDAIVTIENAASRERVEVHF